MSRAAKEERVREVLEELGLWTVRDSRIGKSGARGISGGEMRRVSIACELVTSPSIIFLDEPTSGLDAYNAYVVMDTLSQLARRYGRTVICTIHQPRTDIFSMFDRLIILAAGQMCYSGPANTMVQYLESIGHPVPEGYNIADFSIDLVQQATVSGKKKKDGKEQVAITAELRPVKLVDEEVDSECDEWSKLAKDSPELLPSPAEDSQPSSQRQASELAEKLLKTSEGPKFLSKSDRQGSQFLVYDIEVSLERLVENFTESKQYIEMTDDLNTVTGAEWTPSEFKTASSTYGGTPYTRPVTPYQQVAVILINLRDLAYLFYRRLRGERISDTFNDKHRPTVYEQFKVLSARIFNHLYRDPTLMLANYALSVFIGLMCGVLFYQLDNSIQGMQNRLGLLMFILA
ncbi:(ABC) transporter, partial [Linderina pennispora]